MSLFFHDLSKWQSCLSSNYWGTRTWDVVKISSPFFKPIKYQIPIRTQKCTHDNKGLHTVGLKCIKVSFHFHSTVWPKSASLRMQLFLIRSRPGKTRQFWFHCASGCQYGYFMTTAMTLGEKNPSHPEIPHSRFQFPDNKIGKQFFDAVTLHLFSKEVYC